MAADRGRELKAVLVTGKSGKKMSASVTGAARRWPSARPAAAQCGHKSPCEQQVADVNLPLGAFPFYSLAMNREQPRSLIVYC